MRLPEEKLEEIRGATDLVELIGGFVSLKKSGKSWKGLCPFHTEKTPSFHVVPDRGIYHCFGCNRGGNAFSFLMEHEGLGFLDAVRFLAERAGINLPRPGRAGAAERNEHDVTVRANRAAQEWFRENLADPERGAAAREYLQARGLGPSAVEAFAIGYAPPGWDGLLTKLVRLGLEPPLLERAGLVIRSERSGGFYDRFRDRIMFPILGPTGQPIAFGGRILGEGEPKYLNSPETPVFRKGRGLFGLYVNRAEVRESGEAILVEGYTDLIALHQAGIGNVVAPLGTAFTAEQGKLLSNHTRRVTLLYDGDAAGRAAALRAVPSLLAADVTVRVALLPSGTDPDDLVRDEGPEAVRALLNDAPGWITHLANATAHEGREAQARRVVELLGVISDPLALAVQLGEASNQLGLPEELLRRELAARRGPRAQRASETALPPQRTEPRSGVNKAERGLLILMLRVPALTPFVAEQISPDDFEDPDHRRLLGAIVRGPHGGAIPDPHQLLHQFQDEKKIQGLIAEALAASEEEDRSEKLANDYVIKILRSRLTRERQRLQEELRKAQGQRDDATQMRLFRDLLENKRADQELLSGSRIES